MKLPGRLAWKILGATSLVAVLSVTVTTYALGYALRRFAAFSIERGRQIGGASQRAEEVFRSYFAERKEDFRRRAAEIAGRPVDDLSRLAAVEGLLRASILEGGRLIATETFGDPAERARARAAPPVLVALPRVGAGGPDRVLELTFGIPNEMYENFLALRAAIQNERELDRAYDALAPIFVRQYLGLVAVILVVAPLVGLWLARRVTKRLARLQEAARQVGAGDLSVRVRPAGRDELDELGRSFDRMVGELGDARSRLEYLHKVAAWQEVARRLAHEIKNPLTPVQLAVQELVSKYRGSDPAFERLLATTKEILAEEIGGLHRLVDDFSVLGRLPRVEPAPVDLGSFVAETVRLQPEWQTSVAVMPPGPSAVVMCDKTLLRRVLANLVENAVQAARSSNREPALRIALEAHPERGAVALLVDDNGPGVAAGERTRIFDPYVTHHEGGTGLGLAIVRKIVIDHGGDVTIEDAPPPLGGARFRIELPLAGARSP